MSNFSNAGSGMKTGDIRRLSDIKIPDAFFDRIKTGSDALDKFIGGDELPGIMPGASVLFTGLPGAGKSTLTLQLASIWNDKGYNPLYNIGEENEYAIKYRAQRLELTDDIQIGKFDKVENLCEHVVKIGARILVQDSIQSLVVEDATNAALLRHNVERLVNLSKEHGVTVFMIGHVTKGGHAAGPQKVIHDVDTHIHLTLDKTGSRQLEIKKSRIGPSGISAMLIMDGKGIRLAENVDISDDGQASDADEYIKQLLLSGKKLSGYSYLEDPMLCGLGVTGGKMRELLEKVASRLAAAGLDIVREKINRREHVYVKRE